MFFINNNALDDICARSVEENITYRELNSFVEEFKQYVKPRSLVFVLCSNSIGSIAGYVSFLSNKIVPCLLNNKVDISIVHNLFNIYLPKYFWIPNPLLSVYQKFGNVCFSKFGYSLLVTTNTVYNIHLDLALLMSTSGSTGNPKLVRLSYENILSNAKSISDYLEITSDDKPITSLPMNYSYGLSVINSHLIKGSEILLTDESYIQKGFWEFFKKYNATSFAGVPYTYEILKKIRFFKMDLPSLRKITQAGGKLSEALQLEFANYADEHNIKFYVMYGQTEATARMSYLPSHLSKSKLGSIGIPIPGGKFELYKENQKIVKDDEIGELVYFGSNVFLGYADNINDLRRGNDVGYKLHTGDLAKRDFSGCYYVTGRLKRFLKVYGNRISLDMIEKWILEKYPTLMFACAGRDDNLIVFIEGNDYPCELIQFLSQKTGINQRAFKIKCVEFLPRNEYGKIQYEVLNNMDKY